MSAHRHRAWLIAHARRADSSGVAHVYVWSPHGEHKVSAYFAIYPTSFPFTTASVALIMKVSTPAKALGER